MAEIKITDSEKYLVNNSRIFLQSKNINIFPCSRRGQSEIEDATTCYDPEARLNTERTNRLNIAINGFTDSFVSSFTKDSVAESAVTVGTLVFTLAGYRVEAKSVDPDKIAEFLEANNDNDIIYAYLGLHGGISLNTAGYYTEILYRQSEELADKNYLDVYYEDNKDKTIKDDFFVGISFTKNKDTADTGITPRILPIFSRVDGTWELVETSKLPKIDHGETEDSIKVNGDFTGTTKVVTPAVETNKITSNNTEIIIDKVLKVDTIDSDSTNGLTVKRKLTVEKDIVVNAGNEVNTPQLRVDRITSSNKDNTVTIDNKKLVVNRSLDMRAPAPTDAKPDPDPAKATIEQAVIGDLKVKIDPTLKGSTGKIETDGNIVAKNTIKAPAIYQTVNSSDKPVPFIDLVEQDSGQWQLQISRVNKIEKQN